MCSMKSSNRIEQMKCKMPQTTQFSKNGRARCYTVWKHSIILLVEYSKKYTDLFNQFIVGFFSPRFSCCFSCLFVIFTRICFFFGTVLAFVRSIHIFPIAFAISRGARIRVQHINHMVCAYVCVCCLKCAYTANTRCSALRLTHTLTIFNRLQRIACVCVCVHFASDPNVPYLCAFSIVSTFYFHSLVSVHCHPSPGLFTLKALHTIQHLLLLVSSFVTALFYMNSIWCQRDLGDITHRFAL